MDMTVAKKACKYSLFVLALAIMVFQFPAISVAEEFPLGVDVSPKIINIASERYGEIRIFTDMRYSFFLGSGSEAFVYFNDSNDSVDNIRATRDSLGNLILKFSLESLLDLGDSLVSDAENDVTVVVETPEGTEGSDEYSGVDSVYIVDKKSTESNPRSRTLKIR